MTPARVSVSRSAVAALAAAALALGAPGALAAQDATTWDNHLYDKFQVGVAFTTVLNYSNARVDAANGDLGTTIDFREILGVSSATVQPAIGLRWKPGRHTEFDLGFQFLNQSGDQSVSKTIVIGEDTVSGDLDITSRFSSDNATFQFKYSIFARERHNVGLALGLGAILFDMRFDVSGGACDGVHCVADSLNVTKKFTAPTVSVGAFGYWRLGNRWYVGADARALGARVDRYDLSVFEGNASGQYFLSNRWGLNLAWFYTDVRVDVGPRSDGTVAEDLVGEVSYSYSSIRVGALYAF